MRGLCDERARGNADLQAQVASQNQQREQNQQAMQQQQLELQKQQQVDRERAAKLRQDAIDRQQADREQQESKYKMKFCSRSLNDLSGLNGDELESKCLYIITNLKVIQVIAGGILVGHGISGKVFFIKTKKQYVDEDQISIVANYIGTKKYTSTVGAERTVNAFNYLGDY